MAKISKRGRKTRKRGRQPKTFDQLKRLYAIQEPAFTAKAQTIKGKTESFIWCIDTDSYEGRYYFPVYVVSDFGRIWSLEEEDFISQTVKEDEYRQVVLAKAGDAYKINPSRTAYVHRLIAHYFCDPDHTQRDLLMKVDGVKTEEDLVVHHKSLFSEANGSEYIDRSENLRFIDKATHDHLHEIIKAFRIKATDPDPSDQSPEKRKELARKTIELQEKKLEELKVGFDTMTEMIVRAYALKTDPDNRVDFEYIEDENGKLRPILRVSQTISRRPDNLVEQKPKKKPDNLVEPKTAPLRKSVGLEPLDADKQSDTQQEP